MVKTGELCDIPEKKFEWRIRDFLLLSSDDKNESSEFYLCGSYWAMEIFPSYSEGIGLLVCRRSGAAPVTLECSFSLKTVHGKTNLSRTFTRVFNKGDWVHTKLILYKELLERNSELLPSGVLTVICSLKESGKNNADGYEDSKKIEKNACVESFTQTNDETGNEDLMKSEKNAYVESLTQTNEETENEDSKKIEKNALVESFTQTNEELGDDSTPDSSVGLLKYKVLLDFKELFTKQEDCDIIIKVKEKEFFAHRAILKAQSPVFDSTFRNDTKERDAGVIDVSDCNPTNFLDFLVFLYCGEIEKLSAENVFSLFTTSEVLDIRSKCLEFIKKNLTVDNFCDTFSLALRHSEAHLIKSCTDFFAKNLQKVIVTVKWQLFSAQNPTQSNELLVKALVPN